jgi:hypothetical protein
MDEEKQLKELSLVTSAATSMKIGGTSRMWNVSPLRRFLNVKSEARR